LGLDYFSINKDLIENNMLEHTVVGWMVFDAVHIAGMDEILTT